MKRIFETLSVFCITILAVALIRYSEVQGSSVFIPMMWGLGALLAGSRKESVIFLAGLTRPHLAISLKYYLLSTIVIFPLIGGGFLLYHRSGLPTPPFVVPPGVSIGEWILYQFVLVAIFEELFFRGYIQTQFQRMACISISGEMVTFWFPIVCSALLFGVAHVVVEVNPARFVSFFPGLLFAWLRAKTSSLLAPMLSHGSANVFGMLLIRSVL